ncbi:MAG: hypothetical protein V1661_02870 [bacterium]
MPEPQNISLIQVIIPAIAAIVAMIIAAFFSYYFGFRQYLKQRNRENINKIYVQDGIDGVIENIDKCSFVCQFNFAKAMRIIEYLEKEFGDIKVENKIINKVFSEMEPLIIAPENSIYKLEFLTGGEKILNSFIWLIRIIADSLQFNDYMRYELFFEIECYFSNPERLSEKKDLFLKELKKRIIDFDKDVISKHEMMKVFLLRIKKRVDEVDITDIKILKKVSKDKKIVSILEEIQKYYEENISNKK